MTGGTSSNIENKIVDSMITKITIGQLAGTMQEIVKELLPAVKTAYSGIYEDLTGGDMGATLSSVQVGNIITKLMIKVLDKL